MPLAAAGWPSDPARRRQGSVSRPPPRRHRRRWQGQGLDRNSLHRVLSPRAAMRLRSSVSTPSPSSRTTNAAISLHRSTQRVTALRACRAAFSASAPNASIRSVVSMRARSPGSTVTIHLTRLPSGVRLSTETTPASAVAGSAEAAPAEPAIRARASSRWTWRSMALATSSIPCAAPPDPASRRRVASPTSACRGVFRACARSPARVRARTTSASRASISASISAASGRTLGRKVTAEPRGPAGAEGSDPRADIGEGSKPNRYQRPARGKQRESDDRKERGKIAEESATSSGELGTVHGDRCTDCGAVGPHPQCALNGEEVLAPRSRKPQLTQVGVIGLTCWKFELVVPKRSRSQDSIWRVELPIGSRERLPV